MAKHGVPYLPTQGGGDDEYPALYAGWEMVQPGLQFCKVCAHVSEGFG